MVTIDVTINGGISTGVLQSDSLGTQTGGGSTTQSYTITGVSTNEVQKIADVLVYPSGTTSFSADYSISHTWERQYDDSDGEVDIIVDVTWETDPGNGNDVDLDYEIRT